MDTLMTPKQAYELVKTGHWNKNDFLNWIASWLAAPMKDLIAENAELRASLKLAQDLADYWADQFSLCGAEHDKTKAALEYAHNRMGVDVRPGLRGDPQ